MEHGSPVGVRRHPWEGRSDRRVICGWCGATGHTVMRCSLAPPHVDETNGAGRNGAYTGPLPVRVIPPGVSGQDLANEAAQTARVISPARGRQRQIVSGMQAHLPKLCERAGCVREARAGRRFCSSDCWRRFRWSESIDKRKKKSGTRLRRLAAEKRLRRAQERGAQA